MRPIGGFHGFGRFLEDEEQLHGVFRQKFSYALSQMLLHGIIWWGWAWVVWFFYPNYLQIIWGGLLVYGAVRVLGVLLWWYYNSILVTNMNVVFVHWRRPLEKSITRIDYWNLDEIQVKKDGLGAFMYHYGSLVFSKLSGGEPYIFERIGNPTRVATFIDDYKENAIHERNFSQDNGIKDLLQQVVGRHVEGGILGQPTPLERKMSRHKTQKKSDEDRLYRTHWSSFLPWGKGLASAEIEQDAEEVEAPAEAPRSDEDNAAVHHHHYYDQQAQAAPGPRHVTPIQTVAQAPVQITQEGRVDESIWRQTPIDDDQFDR